MATDRIGSFGLMAGAAFIFAQHQPDAVEDTIATLMLRAAMRGVPGRMPRACLILAALGTSHAQQQGIDAVPKEDTVKAIRGVAFSSDGKWLVTGGLDKRLRLWNV